MRSFAIALFALAACRAAAQPGIGITWQPPIEIAHGGGIKGPWQQNESHFDYVDDPSVALSADGSAAVVWVDHRDKDVHFQIYERDSRPRLGSAVNVSRSPTVFSWLPRIVLADRAVIVLWQEIIFSGGAHGGEIFVARSTDGGATFTAPVNLSRSLGGDGKGRIDADTWANGSVDLALAPSGMLYAAWTEYDGPLWVSASTDGGATFSTPQHVAGNEREPARGPSLAIDRAGNVALAWTYGENPAADIHIAVAHDGRFDQPVVVTRTPTYSDAPKLAFDRTGTLHVTYSETTGGPFAPAHIQYTRSRDGGRTFAAPVTLAPAGTYPSLAVTDGNVLVVWDAIDRDGQPRGLGLARSRDGGEHFARTDLVPASRGEYGGTNGSHQGRLMSRLAARDDMVAVVNASLARGRSSRVWLMRGTLHSGGFARTESGVE